MLGRRNECRESWLVQVVHRLWKAKEPSNSPERNEEMKRRLLIELVEFMTPKSSDGQNLSGELDFFFQRNMLMLMQKYRISKYM